MKLKPAQIEKFLGHPDPAVRLILVYGPDSGLVRERIKTLARSVLDDLSDPFRAAEISEAELRRDPARLADEAAALAMMGGRRVVQIRSAGDAVAKTVEAFLNETPGDALVLIEAGDLGPRSRLRRAVEAAATGAALPCYADTARTLEPVIRRHLEQAGWDIEAAALDYLMSQLGVDRGITHRELEKLALYMGAPAASDAPGRPRIGLDDVRACIGDVGASSLDQIVDAAASGDMAALDAALIRARSAGMAPAAILAAAERHFMQLHVLASRIETGADLSGAIRALRPPVHFSREPALRRQCVLWSARRIAQALGLLANAEASCKSTGLPDAAACGQALLRLAQGARQTAYRR